MLQITIDEPTSARRRIPFMLELPADRNEVQEIDLGDIDTADDFHLTWDGNESSQIEFAADMSSAIETALEALAGITAGDLTVTKQSGVHVYDVEFGVTLAATDVPAISITNPTGFTPVGVTETLHGGVAGAPARNVVLVADEIRVSVNGAANADSLGTVTEIGHGLYYYTATAAEVDTLGFLSATIVREDLALVYGVVQIVPAESALGSPVLRSFTAQAGGASTVTADAGASAVTNFYAPSLAYIRTGTGAGQARLVHASDGSTKVLSVEPAWATIPDATSVVDLLPVPPAFADVVRANHTATGTFGGDLATPEDVADVLVPAVREDLDPELTKINTLTFVSDKVRATLPPTTANP